MKKDRKQILNFLVLFIITGLVLYFSLKDNFHEIMNQIFHLNLVWLLVALFLILAYWIFRTVSVHLIIGKFQKNYTKKQSFRLILITQFFNAVTPFATGGQPFQVYSLKKDGIRLTDGTNIIMQNFIAYQIALVLLGIFAVVYNSFFHIFEKVNLLKHLVTLGFFMNTIVIILLFLIAFGKRFNTFVVNHVITFLSKIRLVKDKEKKRKEWEAYIGNFHTGAKKLVKDKGLLFKTVFANLVALLCLYLVPLALLYGMGNDNVNIITCITSSAYTMLIGSFVPIPGGTGGLEYGYTKFFGNFVKGPILNASMLLWRSITYYLGLIIGAIALTIQSRRK